MKKGTNGSISMTPLNNSVVVDTKSTLTVKRERIGDNVFTILAPCILLMWPSQLSLCARMKFIMFLRFIISSSSWLVFIRHIPFSLFGPNIFLKIFLSNTNSLLIMVWRSTFMYLVITQLECSVCDLNYILKKQDSQCTYYIKLRHVPATIVAVEE